MTKEDKVLWATWMASTDIWEYAVDIVLDFTQMDSYELNRIWENGLRLSFSDGFEFVAFPMKSNNTPEVIALTPDNGSLVYVRFINPDELDDMVVSELKRVGFTAPWVSGLEVKNILVAKWGKNWCDSANVLPETLPDKFDLEPDDLKFFSTKEELEQYYKSKYPQRKIVWR